MKGVTIRIKKSFENLRSMNDDRSPNFFDNKTCTKTCIFIVNMVHVAALKIEKINDRVFQIIKKNIIFILCVNFYVQRNQKLSKLRDCAFRF